MADLEAELRAAALALACPRCGSAAGVSCVNYAGRFSLALHAERTSLAEGGPAKENRDGARRRTPGQGRVDPVVRVRRLDDDQTAAA